ncbi:C3a anaphylatoxin chemotactic receptor-like [Pygocentrus nattereri]|uniref:C3a anaphylatoxin chemotactic receptor-like n=1 Tax=Pygocentrus nattereri TaxID=42514 RepID=UPI001891222D|nr:C3a anaphylatoxin chemotactic receptor-like [Pygocentrus nattereri]
MQLSNSSDLNSTAWSQTNLVTSVLMGFFCAVGVPGNIAVIVIIVLWFKKDNFTVHLMLNLAASDILCLMTLPVWMYNRLFDWSIGRWPCKFFISLVYCSASASLMIVTMISVHRYVHVCFPEKWSKLGKKGEKFLLCTIWVFGFAFSIPAIFTREVVLNGSRRECGRITSSDELRLVVAVLETLLAFVLPLSIMVTSYYCLHKRVTQGALFHSQRLTRMVTSIVVMTFIFSSPCHLINLVEIFGIAMKHSYPGLLDELLTFKNSVGDVAVSFTFINSCMNPLLYAFASRSLRQSCETR